MWLLLWLVACQPRDEPEPRPYNQESLIALAKARLTSLQAPSIHNNREYCGLIGLDAAGVLRASPAREGRYNRCSVIPPQGWQIIAHYHTHGAFDPRTFAERPSHLDMTAVGSNDIIGFLSTPGGRFWRFDSRGAELLCGRSCLPRDPLQADLYGVKTSYTPEEISGLQQQ